MVRRALNIAVLSCVLLAGSAAAEVLKVSGVYPAENDGAAALESILVDEFGGTDGPALAIKIEDVLRAADLAGRPYFRILPPHANVSAAGILRGTAEAEASFDRFTEERERCQRKDDNGKCTERTKVKVYCYEHTLELAVNLRLIARDGALLYSSDRPEKFEETSCEDDSSGPESNNDILRDLIGKAASRLITAFVPVARTESIRVNESRKGLSRPDAELFKQAVPLTKTDPAAACQAWSAIGIGEAAHLPTQFNIGLCAESEGRADEAVIQYRQLLRLQAGFKAARDGLERLAARERAQSQLIARRW